MRAFVIADAYKRKAKPIGMLFWEEDPSCEQGCFTIEISAECADDDLPLSLAFCMGENNRKAAGKQSEEWVRTRIVPEDRHNITEVLMANGLSRYSEIELLVRSQGRSSDDDFCVYRVDLPDKLPAQTVDELLAAMSRRRSGGEVSYALVDIPDTCQDADSGPLRESAAQRVGMLVRRRRKEAGLTQGQLAIRAGISQAVLSRLESGAGNPTLGLLEDVADALGATLDVSIRCEPPHWQVLQAIKNPLEAGEEFKWCAVRDSNPRRTDS